jgi:hypothetical protein
VLTGMHKIDTTFTSVLPADLELGIVALFTAFAGPNVGLTLSIQQVLYHP